MEDRPFHQVGFPHAEAGTELARHFLEQGARRVRFVLLYAEEDFRAPQRAQGYARAMAAAGLAADVRRADVGDDSFCARHKALAAGGKPGAAQQSFARGVTNAAVIFLLQPKN